MFGFLKLGDDIGPRERLAFWLIAAQGFFLTITDATIYVAGYPLFIDLFGAEFFPILYIAVGLAAALLFVGLAALQQRVPVGKLSLGIFIAIALFALLAYVGLERGIATTAVIFALAAFFPLYLSILLILLGAQAGYLFHVRQMKRIFPLLIVGAVIGFILGSLASPAMIRLLGELNRLLLVGFASSLVAIGALLVTLRHFPEELMHLPRRESGGPQLSVRRLLTSRYPATLFLYQMLSMIGTQLVIYIFLVQAEVQFPSSTALADFFGAFGGWRNVASLVFMLFIAGSLMERFGLRVGLTINPLIVVLMLVVMAIVQGSAPDAVSLLFWLTVLAYVLDNLLSDGITSTSIKTAYQVLPVAHRTTIETLVEGVGVPLALTLTGLFLLGFNALPWVTLQHVIYFALLVSLLWLAASVAANRRYSGALIERLRRRLIEPDELSLDDGSTLGVVLAMLHDETPRNVMLALDLLEHGDHPTLDHHLVGLLDRAGPELLPDVLERIAARRVAAARPQLETLLADPVSPDLVAPALLALASIEGEAGVGRITPYLDDPAPATREAALVALRREGGAPGAATADIRIRALASDASPEARTAAARILGAAPTPSSDGLVPTLLADPEPEVRRRALEAAARARSPALWPLVVEALNDPPVRHEALEALLAGGEVTLDAVEHVVDDETRPLEQRLRLLRLCGLIGGERATASLRLHLSDPHPEIALQALEALVRSGYREWDTAALERRLAPLVARARRILAARAAMGEQRDDALCRALAGEEWRARQTIFHLLALHYDPLAMQRVAEHVARGDKRRRALALEMLEVHLPRRLYRQIIPLIDDGTALEKRIAALQAPGEMATLDRAGWLERIILERAEWPEAWTRACAIYSAAAFQTLPLERWLDELPEQQPPVVGETVTWARRQGAARDGASPNEGDPMLLTIEKVAILSNVDIFADVVPDTLLAAVAGIVEQLYLPPDETFITEGEIEDCMYIVIEGEVRVHSQGRTIITLGPGKSVGELAVLDPEPRSASVTTVTDCRLFRIDRAPFDEVMADRPGIARGVIRALCDRIRAQGRLMAGAE